MERFKMTILRVIAWHTHFAKAAANAAGHAATEREDLEGVTRAPLAACFLIWG